MRRHGLRDDQWARIRDLLPGRLGHVGVTAQDNRLFVEAVLYRYRTGVPWRDLPERFGCGAKVHTRFSRWAKAGVWERVFQHLAAACAIGGTMTPCHAASRMASTVIVRRRNWRCPGGPAPARVSKTTGH